LQSFGFEKVFRELDESNFNCIEDTEVGWKKYELLLEINTEKQLQTLFSVSTLIKRRSMFVE